MSLMACICRTVFLWPVLFGAIAQNGFLGAEMARKNGSDGFIELYDLTKKQAVSRAPLAEIGFIPRPGERIFLPVEVPGNWESYTVVTVEYFLGYDQFTNEPSRSLMRGIGRVTLYVEQAK
jgi:hypothetical protein